MLSTLSFDEYLSTHAAHLFRLELLFALTVVAAGCVIALYGACRSAAALDSTTSIGLDEKDAEAAENSEMVFALGKVPVPMQVPVQVSVSDLSSRYGEPSFLHRFCAHLPPRVVPPPNSHILNAASASLTSEVPAAHGLHPTP